MWQCSGSGVHCAASPKLTSWLFDFFQKAIESEHVFHISTVQLKLAENGSSPNTHRDRNNNAKFVLSRDFLCVVDIVWFFFSGEIGSCGRLARPDQNMSNKIRAVYEALDSRKTKQALKLLGPLLEKKPDSAQLKILKALALVRRILSPHFKRNRIGCNYFLWWIQVRSGRVDEGLKIGRELKSNRVNAFLQLRLICPCTTPRLIARIRPTWLHFPFACMHLKTYTCFTSRKSTSVSTIENN